MSSTSSSKSLALVFLFGAFLAGGAVGYAGDRALSHDRPRARPFTEKDMRKELYSELNLTPAQRAALDSAYDWRKARQEEIMQPIRPQIEAMRDSTTTWIISRLDTTQVVTYKKIRERVRAMSDSARRAQKGDAHR